MNDIVALLVSGFLFGSVVGLLRRHIAPPGGGGS